MFLTIKRICSQLLDKFTVLGRYRMEREWINKHGEIPDGHCLVYRRGWFVKPSFMELRKVY